MPFNLNDLASQTAVAKVDFMGQSATVMYNPSVLTATNIGRAQKGGDEGFLEFFTSLVKDWDVKSGTRKVPISRKGLEEVPVPFLRACVKAVMDTGKADSEEGKASSDG